MATTGSRRITWLGHAAFHIETPGGKRILIDPFLTGNPSCPDDWKRIDQCDLILITHGHGDHVGDAPAIAAATGCPTAAIVELAGLLAARGVSGTIGMNKGGTLKVGDISVTMVNAFHSTGFDEDGETLYAGEAAGFVVRLEDGFTFYHSGDTDVFGDMRLISELYQPDLAILPIGDHYTMGPRQAALAIRLLGVKRVIPMHYGTFPVLTGTPDELARLTSDIEGLRIHRLQPGESVS